MERADLMLAAGLPGLAVTVAGLARSRALTQRRLAERLGAADAAGRAGVEQAASEERRRIAAEIQRLVQRDVGSIATDVTAARAAIVAGSRPGLATALESVSETARGTIVELRQLLEAVDPAAPRPVAPEAADADLHDLGPAVRVVEQGDPRLTPPGTRFVAGRLLRDLLLPGGAATVRLVHRGDGLEVRVAGRGTRPRALTDPGTLVAARERARLHGGSLAATSGVRGWRVRVWLPSDVVAVTQRLPWSPRTIDAALGAGIALLVAVDCLVLPTEHRWFSIAAGTTTIALPMLVRRRAPLAVSASVAVGQLGGSAAGVIPKGPAVPYFVVTIVPFAVGAHAPTAGRALLAVAMVTAATVAGAVPELRTSGWPDPRDLPLLAGYGVLIGAVTWYARHHHTRALALAIDEEELGRQHPALVRAAVGEERRRVARDLHDVVSHGVTLCGVLAGAALARSRSSDAPPDEATLEALEAATAQTGIELARLVRALELPDAAAAPVGLRDLPGLVAGAGEQVALHDALDGAAVPAAVSTCAYRVVQEALTNAHRHAGSPPTRVHVHADDGHLHVEVVSDPPARAAWGRGSGRGLAGMRDRVADVGGALDAGPLADGGYRVAARLPLALV